MTKVWKKTVGVRLNEEMVERKLTKAASVRESALFGARIKGDLNAVQAYADREYGGDLVKALNVLLEMVEG